MPSGAEQRTGGRRRGRSAAPRRAPTTPTTHPAGTSRPAPSRRRRGAMRNVRVTTPCTSAAGRGCPWRTSPGGPVLDRQVHRRERDGLAHPRRTAAPIPPDLPQMLGERPRFGRPRRGRGRTGRRSRRGGRCRARRSTVGGAEIQDASGEHRHSHVMAPAPVPPGYTSLTPFLVVDGARAAIAFYTSLRRDGRAVMDGPDGTVAHAELDFGHGRLQLSDPNPRSTSSPRPPARRQPLDLPVLRRRRRGRGAGEGARRRRARGGLDLRHR